MAISKETSSIKNDMFSVIHNFFKNNNNNLQNVNEKLYEQNVELAVKNKTLSLLYRLYEIATESLDIITLSSRLTKNTAQILNLPFVGVFLINSKEDSVSLLSFGSSYLEQHNIQFPKEICKSVFITDALKNENVIVDCLKNLKKKQTKKFVDILLPFCHANVLDFFKKNIPINVCFLYPIQTNTNGIGVLMVGLDKSYEDLTTFEKDSISNLSNVFAVAIEKTIFFNDLKDANIRLQEIDRQKTEFLSIASHQLRTPLSIIKGYIELIKDGAFGKVTKKTITVLHDMDESNERLVKLVDEFLDITRIEQGRTKYSFKEESMHELIDSVIKELHDKAETKGLHIMWKKTVKDDMVFMDSEKIRHVVFNYVDNAIKYSPEGDITITFVQEGDDAVLRVKDHGFGFNKEDEANFFQKFYRGKNVVGTNVNGTGLGIYVCRKFIEKHTGSVWAHSEGLGKGSEFGFRILMKQQGRAPKIEIDEINQEIIPQKNTETEVTVASS